MEQLTIFEGMRRRAIEVPSERAHYASSASDEWYTPPHVVALVVAVLGQIDLDPCADGGHNVPALRHFTIVDDGLNQAWGGRVFMNPPYTGRQCSRWVRKLLHEVREEHVAEAITLTPARTDTKWFQRLWGAGAICFVHGRLNFLRPGGVGSTSAPFPSALTYFGHQRDRFAAEFSQLGKVVFPGAQIQ